jgi:hypothetical protein
MLAAPVVELAANDSPFRRRDHVLDRERRAGELADLGLGRNVDLQRPNPPIRMHLHIGRLRAATDQCEQGEQTERARHEQVSTHQA